jgi:hypothetical protein
MRRWFLSLAAVVVLATAAGAHHSLSGIYDTSRQVRVEGRVTEFHFVNPHPFLTLSVQLENGRRQQWRLEMDNRVELARIGVSEETFRAGDRIVVSGDPAREEQPLSLYVRRLDRLRDGFTYEQVGTSPRIRSSN